MARVLFDTRVNRTRNTRRQEEHQRLPPFLVPESHETWLDQNLVQETPCL